MYISFVQGSFIKLNLIKEIIWWNVINVSIPFHQPELPIVWWAKPVYTRQSSMFNVVRQPQYVVPQLLLSSCIISFHELVN